MSTKTQKSNSLYCVIQVDGHNVDTVELFLNEEDARERIYDFVFALERIYGKVICVSKDKSTYRVLNRDIWLYLWGGVPIQ